MLSRPNTPTSPARSFRTVGIVFAGLGAFAILVPAAATVIVEQLVAWLMLFWGVAGLLFARSFRAFSEWKIVAAGFAVVALIGLFFVIYPGTGAAFMTAILIAVFLMEGILSILLGLRMSGQVAHWQWIVASGACSFILGAVILSQWPQTTNWVVGFLVGLNFLSTGIAMLLVSRAARS
tara:strand:- start:4086 stop:4622 length:537 start_codon:yes stop_codon:yes gene_type:complete